MVIMYSYYLFILLVYTVCSPPILEVELCAELHCERADIVACHDGACILRAVGDEFRTRDSALSAALVEEVDDVHVECEHLACLVACAGECLPASVEVYRVAYVSILLAVIAERGPDIEAVECVVGVELNDKLRLLCNGLAAEVVSLVDFIKYGST